MLHRVLYLVRISQGLDVAVSRELCRPLTSQDLEETKSRSSASKAIDNFHGLLKIDVVGQRTDVAMGTETSETLADEAVYRLNWTAEGRCEGVTKHQLDG